MLSEKTGDMFKQKQCRVCHCWGVDVCNGFCLCCNPTTPASYRKFLESKAKSKAQASTS